MRLSPCIACLWPGLPHLWWRGEWRALGLAVGFAAWLNAILLATFVWNEWLPTWLRCVGWLVILGSWGGSAWYGWRTMPQCLRNDRSPSAEDLFTCAQTEYLNRHWLEAESLLTELVRRQDRDPEANLMLATLCRHTERFDEAHGYLEGLERMEGGGKWALEIAKEREILEEFRNSTPDENDTDSEQFTKQEDEAIDRGGDTASETSEDERRAA